jgi:hypothetical protein
MFRVDQCWGNVLDVYVDIDVSFQLSAGLQSYVVLHSVPGMIL